MIKIIPTALEGLLIIESELYKDERGFFLESYQLKQYEDSGITDLFVQDNHSRSARHVLRGLHFQVKQPQSQIVTVIRGCIYDVVVDLRQTSSTFGEWFGIELSDEGTRQLYMPPGFAHGFCVISDWVDLHYKVSQFYDPLDEGGLHWDDPDIGIVWPIAKPRVSKRDASFPKLKSINHDKLPSIR